MKRLFVVRHPEKIVQKQGLDDYDIDLSQKGLDDAHLMSEQLANKNIKINLIVSSPSTRTKKTAEIFASNLNYTKSIMYNEVLYMAYVNELLETISYTFDSVDSMVLIGHNPSLTALAITLLGFKEEFKMGAIMQIDFDCNSWIDICKENASLISYESPENKT
jgi:phosphohistidine phosphatase